MRLALTAASLLLLAALPLAAAADTCTEGELLYVDGHAVHGCIVLAEGTIGRHPHAACGPHVPEARVLGDRVPATGGATCVPPTIMCVPSTSGSPGFCTVVGYVPGVVTQGPYLVACASATAGVPQTCATSCDAPRLAGLRCLDHPAPW